MSDREKVRKGLEWILDGDRFGFGENWHIDSEPKTEEEQAGFYIQRAIELLKEQEPKLVRIDEDSVHCPSCGNELFTYPRQKFCDECGQEVKWNE